MEGEQECTAAASALYQQLKPSVLEPHGISTLREQGQEIKHGHSAYEQGTALTSDFLGSVF